MCKLTYFALWCNNGWKRKLLIGQTVYRYLLPCLYVAVKTKGHRLPLRFKAIHCHVTENATRHITKQYEQTKDHRSSPGDQHIPGGHGDFNVSDSGSGHETDSLAHLSVDSLDTPPQTSAPRAATHLRAAFQSSAAQLVVRRGQKFTVELAFDRPYDPRHDDIIFTFHFGTETLKPAPHYSNNVE